MIEMQLTDDQAGTCSAAGFHAVGGWKHAAEGPVIRDPEQPRGRTRESGRTLPEISEYEWAPAAATGMLPELALLAGKHAAIVNELRAESEKLKGQDLATAKLGSPLSKNQGRLKLEKAALAFNEKLLPYYECVLPAADERYQAALAKLPPIRAKIDAGLADLGFPPTSIPGPAYARNHLLVTARNESTFAGNDRDSVLRERNGCRERIEHCRKVISEIEDEIRSALV